MDRSRSRSTAPGAVALVTLAVHAFTNGQYGLFRDELYFIACGRHPAWGYVDQPPLAPLIDAASMWLSGPDRIWLFRMPAALAHAGTVLLTGLLARRLGGGSFAALLASLTAAIVPLLLVGGHLLSMNSFEPLLVVALATTLVAIADGGDERLWLLAGGLVGVGVLNKHSMVFFAACFFGALLITPARRLLRSRWTALGAALALLLILPHALWQLRAGLPMLELLRNGQLHKNAPFSLPGYLIGQLVELNPVSALVWAAGVLWLAFAARARRYRFLALAWALAVALFAVLHGKVYYVAPAYPMLLAAGGAAWEKTTPWRWVRGATLAVILVGGAAIAPLAIPI